MQIPAELSLSVKKALWRLSLGDLTAGEMLAYLTDPRRKSTAFPQEIAERTVSLLISEGFLDDKRYLQLLVRRLDAKGFGPRRIRQELSRHRFPPRYVEAALARNVDYTRRALRFLQKKAGAAELSSTPEGRKKLCDALVRYGYDYATAGSAVGLFSQKEEEEEENE